ncbi:unnamed protein product [Rotaria magnacalcarata]|uniref:Uncharacterized protein n=1 Tax=Rotaria magnacalcarata TaxID=392030 RepID=A0A816RA48_9BILA|nr:unnamed protein product [Rotaria magnacalcarata]CAF4131818.1 unnamed protein product [Rotaria magnacalcarata]
MTIDPSKTSTSIIANGMIDKHSALPQEQEILFIMHTVFHVVEITQTTRNSRLWEVQLIITDESDPQLAHLADRIKEEISGRGWHRMGGQLMLKVGYFDQAEEPYNELLENASDDSNRAHVYHQLGVMHYHQCKYQQAVTFYEKDLEISGKTLSADNPQLGARYNNIGLVYNNMGEYSNALEFYEKSVKIKQISLPPTHSDLTTSYNNIGGVYSSMDEYSKTLEFYEKLHQIYGKALPPTHPELADKSTLPEKNPNRAITYSDIGDVHRLMGDYEKALAFHQKALNIQENAKRNPLDCATT